ncbi:MAG: hypothetical protein O3A25_07065 [Acidobacteria bacterium]|nr:hypothetical protein [Acidobacteriota bacterium]
MQRHLVLCAVLAAIYGAPAVVNAQAQSWQDVQVADIETMRDKFIQLGQAFGDSQYDWRPMDGVRSVREVLGLAVAEAHMFPTGWGFEAPAPAAPGFREEMERTSDLARTDMLNELASSFEFLIGVVRDMSEPDRVAAGSYFGQAMPVHASIATAMADMHEHLGQLIAYARTNQVVPPWSAAAQ